jgi:hypothetical protein
MRPGINGTLEHRYLLGTMVFTIAGDVVRDLDEEYEACSWLEKEVSNNGATSLLALVSRPRARNEH